MTSNDLAVANRASGLGIMMRVVGRIQRRSAVIWILALGAMMIGTVAGVATLYDTAAKIHTYAESVTSGSALVAINGKVEGIDSLGGVIQDEFGFMASFLLPLLGIALVARATRREEESGRLELLLGGGRISRQQPAAAAILIATATIVATGLLFALGLVAFGVPLAGSVLYALSLCALAFVFAGLAALFAQLALHSRDVYAWSLMVLAVSFLLRGIGDVTGTWLTWLSPLGWAEKAAPFGDQRWWALAIPFLVGLALSGAAVRLAARRDLGSSLIRGGTGPDRAARFLRGPIGFAIRIHLPGTLGWLAGAILLTGTMGALSQQALDAMSGNPAFADALGITSGRPVDGFLAAVHLYLAVIATGYVVQTMGTLRAEEAEGRLETRLSGTLSRALWLASHTLVVLTGLLTIVVASSLVLGLASAVSVGTMTGFGSTVGAGLAYLPAELIFAGLTLAIFGIRPRLYGIAWAGFAVMAFIALLGPGLKFAQWVLNISPTTHVGNPPSGTTQIGELAIMTGVAVVIAVIGFVAFRRRGVPQG